MLASQALTGRRQTCSCAPRHLQLGHRVHVHPCTAQGLQSSSLQVHILGSSLCCHEGPTYVQPTARVHIFAVLHGLDCDRRGAAGVGPSAQSCANGVPLERICASIAHQLAADCGAHTSQAFQRQRPPAPPLSGPGHHLLLASTMGAYTAVRDADLAICRSLVASQLVRLLQKCWLACSQRAT